MSPQVQPPPSRRRSRISGPVAIVVRVVAAAGLVFDAVVHLLLAPDYDANRGILITQVELFRIQAAVAIVAAFALLGVRRRGTDVLVLLIAASAAAAVLAYRYLDLGPLLGLPDMYEPGWFPLKILSALAEVLAALAVLVLLAATGRRSPVRGDRSGGGAHRAQETSPPPP